MAVQQFKLPDLGEGLTEGDILKWTVAVGDTVEVNDTIAEVETVKAAVELPSPFAGVVTALHADEGETVPVGTPIISIEVGAPTSPRSAEDLVPAVPGLPGEGALPATAEDEKQMTLVGYGPREESGGRRRRRRPEATAAGAQASFNLPPATGPHPAPEPSVVEPAPADRTSRASAPGAHRVLAKPPVRKLAKSLGVDLAALTPTGPNGTISRDDVESAAGAATARQRPRPAGSPPPGRRAGARETRIPIKGVRKHTAAAMVRSAFTAPHVTEFVTVDVTATMELRDRVAARREFRDVKVSPLLFVAKAVLLAAARTPGDQRHLGRRGRRDRAQALRQPRHRRGHRPRADRAQHQGRRPAVAARARRTRWASSPRRPAPGAPPPADMSGGTFTITNVGVFGVDTGTPILNPGESGHPRLRRGAPDARGWSAAARTSGSSRGGSPSWRCPSTTASSTASRARGSWPMWVLSSQIRGWHCSELCDGSHQVAYNRWLLGSRYCST